MVEQIILSPMGGQPIAVHEQRRHHATIRHMHSTMVQQTHNAVVVDRFPAKLDVQGSNPGRSAARQYAVQAWAYAFA